MDISIAGKCLGRTEGNSYFTVRKPNHYMIKFNGFGISESVLLHLKSKGIEFVRIRYEGERGNKFYKTTVEKFLSSQKVHVFEDKFHRFGGMSDRQLFLSLTEMEEMK